MDKYIVQQSDVGKSSFTPVRVTCEYCGHIENEFPFEPLGTVIQKDVGKICKKIKGVWYVENQEQFEKRTTGEIKKRRLSAEQGIPDEG